MGEAKIFLNHCETNILPPVIRIEITDSYMVRPVLQEKFVRSIKKYRAHISGL